MSGRGGGTGPAPRDTNPPGIRSPAPTPSVSADAPPDMEPPPASDATPPPTKGNCSMRREIRVVNPLGLHMRVADRFSKTAKQYTCTVTVWNGEQKADGTDIWALIGLLVMHGSEVVLEVDGPDASSAVDLLAEILASPGGEDYTI